MFTPRRQKVGANAYSPDVRSNRRLAAMNLVAKTTGSSHRQQPLRGRFGDRLPKVFIQASPIQTLDRALFFEAHCSILFGHDRPRLLTRSESGNKSARLRCQRRHMSYVTYGLA
jgi:hypothetical protein